MSASARLVHGTKRQAHLGLLRLYRRLPPGARRRLVRFVAPSFTVGAICVIERRDGAILLIRHAYRDRWGLPGGLLSRGENPADAARREVLEEIGVPVDLIGEAVPVVDAVPQRVDLVYRARLTSDDDAELVRPTSPEIEEVRWFPPDALPEVQPETATALIALARHATGFRVR